MLLPFSFTGCLQTLMGKRHVTYLNLMRPRIFCQGAGDLTFLEGTAAKTGNLNLEAAPCRLSRPNEIIYRYMAKKNCWEVMMCGREPGGKNVEELGICPAAADGRLDKVHGGSKAGRACWVIAGTFCNGTVHGTFAQKYRDCSVCEFYRQVRKEEGTKYQTSLVLLKKIKAIK